MLQKVGLILLPIILITGCDLSALNSPYKQIETDESVLYSSFSLRPKHLDPARSYSSNEVSFTGQIYEPPLQYHYLKRPYKLIPLTATELPIVNCYDADDQLLPDDVPTEQVAYSTYEVTIENGIYYQPHPAFAKNQQGRFVYHQLTSETLSEIKTLSDFELTGTRELIAADYVHQIKRLAHPEIHSPILGVMSEHIIGLAEFAKQLQAKHQSGQSINLNDVEVDGVKVIDRYRYQITVKGKYPQLRYWLAMAFFAPMPWEAESFYQQAGLVKKNITLDWFPVGTGPYQLTEHDPNRRMVLERNPNFHGEIYPATGEESDEQGGLLSDRGKAMPFVDKVVFSLEKENIPYWNKFLQGYYDASGISSDSFDQSIQVSSNGAFGLSDAMKQKGIELSTTVTTSIGYLGFNMFDPVVGGNRMRARKLRQAISIAIDYEEYISIFANGRGIAAQGPIPPGIFGHLQGEQGTNSVVYDWDGQKANRKSIDEAKQILLEAGYPSGRDEETGQPLILYFDVSASGPDDKARMNWMRKQFQKLGIQLVVRNTDYNRFQEKIRLGQAQLFQWGWNADYPDPENFLFLLYGGNGKVSYGGQNATNYTNDKFDKLFEQMRVMENTLERQKIIDEMVQILRDDAPWVWGFHPKQFSLYHAWNENVKPNLMANNTLKYRNINTHKRNELRQQWNQPVFWPLLLFIGLIVMILLPAVLMFRQKKRAKIQFD